MQTQTGKKGNVTLNTQNNVEETHSEDSNLVEVKKIEGTPFTIVKTERGYFLAFGQHRLTEPMETEAIATHQLIEKGWDITTQVIAIIVEKTWEIKTHDRMTRSGL